jgi:hypothetical protein
LLLLPLLLPLLLLPMRIILSGRLADAQRSALRDCLTLGCCCTCAAPVLVPPAGGPGRAPRNRHPLVAKGSHRSLVARVAPRQVKHTQAALPHRKPHRRASQHIQIPAQRRLRELSHVESTIQLLAAANTTAKGAPLRVIASPAAIRQH